MLKYACQPSQAIHLVDLDVKCHPCVLHALVPSCDISLRTVNTMFVCQRSWSPCKLSMQCVLAAKAKYHVCLPQAISLMSAHGSTVECYCLMQVLRGAEPCTLAHGDEAHNVLRQYRQQCTSSKASPEVPGSDGQWFTICGCHLAVDSARFHVGNQSHEECIPGIINFCIALAMHKCCH